MDKGPNKRIVRPAGEERLGDRFNFKEMELGVDREGEERW